MSKRHLQWRRKTRLWLGGILALCLMLNQLVVAAYVCPQHVDRAASADGVMPDCHRHADAKHPGLCHQHCNPADAAPSADKAPTVPPGIVPTLPPGLAPNSELAGAVATRVAREHLAAPPPCIEQLCRFLI